MEFAKGTVIELTSSLGSVCVNDTEMRQSSLMNCKIALHFHYCFSVNTFDSLQKRGSMT